MTVNVVNIIGGGGGIQLFDYLQINFVMGNFTLNENKNVLQQFGAYIVLTII